VYAHACWLRRVGTCVRAHAFAWTVLSLQTHIAVLSHFGFKPTCAPSRLLVCMRAARMIACPLKIPHSAASSVVQWVLT
jgi:hypothetical protein